MLCFAENLESLKKNFDKKGSIKNEIGPKNGRRAPAREWDSLGFYYISVDIYRLLHPDFLLKYTRLLSVGTNRDLGINWDNDHAVAWTP